MPATPHLDSKFDFAGASAAHASSMSRAGHDPRRLLVPHGAPDPRRAPGKAGAGSELHEFPGASRGSRQSPESDSPRDIDARDDRDAAPGHAGEEAHALDSGAPKGTNAPAALPPTSESSMLIALALEAIGDSTALDDALTATPSARIDDALGGARALGELGHAHATAGAHGNSDTPGGGELDSLSTARDSAEGASLALRAENAALRHVDRGLHALLVQRGGTLIMRLSPPALGSLEIRMTFEGGRVDVLFRGAGVEACRLLEGNLGMLRQSLERHGVGVGRLAVEPAEFRRAEELARSGHGDSFDAAGRESQGRQEAEREWRWRTDPGLAAPLPARPAFEFAGAAEGPSPWPSSHRTPSRRTPSPAATAS